jgi:hypothetical protein
MQHLAQRQVEWLSRRRNFLAAMTVAIGVPFSAWTLSQYGSYGGLIWWVYLLVVSVGCGLLGGFLLWALYWKPTFIDQRTGSNSKP